MTIVEENRDPETRILLSSFSEEQRSVIFLDENRPCDVPRSNKFSRTAAASSVGVAVAAADFFVATFTAGLVSLAGDFNLAGVPFLTASAFLGELISFAFSSALAAVSSVLAAESSVWAAGSAFVSAT